MPAPSIFPVADNPLMPAPSEADAWSSTSGLLTFPTGMTLGPVGALYISNVGFGPPPIGLGQILRVQLEDKDDD